MKWREVLERLLRETWSVVDEKNYRGYTIILFVGDDGKYGAAVRGFGVDEFFSPYNDLVEAEQVARDFIDGREG